MEDFEYFIRRGSGTSHQDYDLIEGVHPFRCCITFSILTFAFSELFRKIFKEMSWNVDTLMLYEFLNSVTFFMLYHSEAAMFQHYGYSAIIFLSAIHFAVSFYLNRRAAAYTDDLYDQEKPDWVTPPNTGEDGKMLRTIGAFLSYIPSCFLWHLIQQYNAMYVTEHVGMYQFTDSLVTIIGFEFFFIASLRQIAEKSRVWHPIITCMEMFTGNGQSFGGFLFHCVILYAGWLIASQFAPKRKIVSPSLLKLRRKRKAAVEAEKRNGTDARLVEKAALDREREMRHTVEQEFLDETLGNAETFSLTVSIFYLSPETVEASPFAYPFANSFNFRDSRNMSKEPGQKMRNMLPCNKSDIEGIDYCTDAKCFLGKLIGEVEINTRGLKKYSDVFEITKKIFNPRVVNKTQIAVLINSNTITIFDTIQGHRLYNFEVSGVKFSSKNPSDKYHFGLVYKESRRKFKYYGIRIPNGSGIASAIGEICDLARCKREGVDQVKQEQEYDREARHSTMKADEEDLIDFYSDLPESDDICEQGSSSEQNVAYNSEAVFADPFANSFNFRDSRNMSKEPGQKMRNMLPCNKSDIEGIDYCTDAKCFLGKLIGEVEINTRGLKKYSDVFEITKKIFNPRVVNKTQIAVLINSNTITIFDTIQGHRLYNFEVSGVKFSSKNPSDKYHFGLVYKESRRKFKYYGIRIPNGSGIASAIGEICDLARCKREGVDQVKQEQEYNREARHSTMKADEEDLIDFYSDLPESDDICEQGSSSEQNVAYNSEAVFADPFAGGVQRETNDKKIEHSASLEDKKGHTFKNEKQW
ncbi:hypothetical protein GCK72_005057 [Caenorhabditis remanei]|uniref:Uncharacterized protein n=1 Tax=Caenorhabditis remanei TaxID=31234 RepID=A0A6A5HCT4_CAERE|nr:hypothetical protein GCK72_005057 [Caenorhabditis remanei]KAF1765105.1 hypothetical protein GCK72_005057 [Caenorhabditis remanei]